MTSVKDRRFNYYNKLPVPNWGQVVYKFYDLSFNSFKKIPE
jgi:hypothetical protein